MSLMEWRTGFRQKMGREREREKETDRQTDTEGKRADLTQNVTPDCMVSLVHTTFWKNPIGIT